MKYILKKKSLILTFIMVLAFSLVACGENGVNENGGMDDVNMEEEVEESDSMEMDEVKLDSNLSGIELLKSFSIMAPKTMRVEAETYTFGRTIKSVSYIDGNKTRLETDMVELGTSVSINLPDEDVIYYYEEGNTEGNKIVGMSKEEALTKGYTKDDTELFADITDQASEDMTARVDMLDGEEVIYIEATEADDDMGEMLVKMWYSVKYGMPLKYEIISGEQSMVSYNIIAIEKNVKLDKALFQPPEGVNFIEMDMSGMFEADMLEELLEQ